MQSRTGAAVPASISLKPNGRVWLLCLCSHSPISHSTAPGCSWPLWALWTKQRLFSICSKLLVKNSECSLEPLPRSHSLPTVLLWPSVGKWLADVQGLPILPKPLNNLSNSIFKAFTVSADSCTVQPQGDCTYPRLSRAVEIPLEPPESRAACSGASTGVQTASKLGWKLCAGY